LAKRNGDESVMIYALKRTSSVIIRTQNWFAFEAHLCHIALSFPNTLQTIARLLATYSAVGYKLQCDRLARLANAIVEDHAPLAHHSEVAWSLWLCKELDLALTVANIDRVSTMDSSICALILLDLDTAGKLVKHPDLSYWQRFRTTDALRGELWLLSYEAGARGWGGFTDVHIRADAQFAELLRLGVRFYDGMKTLTPIFRPKADALTVHHLQSIVELFALADVEDFVDYDEGDGGYDDVGDDDDDDAPPPVNSVTAVENSEDSHGENDLLD
jgi:hypothetical protein